MIFGDRYRIAPAGSPSKNEGFVGAALCGRPYRISHPEVDGGLNSGLLGGCGKEAAEAGNAFFILPLNPRMIDEGVPVGNEVAQAHSATHVFRQIPIDRSPARQNVKSRGRIIRRAPILL